MNNVDRHLQGNTTVEKPNHAALMSRGRPKRASASYRRASIAYKDMNDNDQMQSKIIHTSTSYCVVKKRERALDFKAVNDVELRQSEHSRSTVYEFSNQGYVESEVMTMVQRMDTRR